MEIGMADAAEEDLDLYVLFCRIAPRDRGRGKRRCLACSRISFRVVHDMCSYLSRFRPDQAWYCSSLTFSIQLTVLPSRCSKMAMCVMPVVDVAPCQCFSRGGHHTTSPGRISSFGPPSLCIQPHPEVTIRVCPSGWMCHAVRAPGSNVTLTPRARAGSGASK